MSMKRITTGNPELDKVLRGGFLANSINVVMGAPGTGKTILAEQLAFANAAPARPALYLTTLSEPLEKFIQHGQGYSFFDSAKVGTQVYYEDLGLLLKERGIGAFTEILTELIIERNPQVIVIDSFKALESLWPPGKAQREILFDVASVLSSYDCTTLLVGEYADQMMTELAEFAIADGVLKLVRQQSGIRSQRYLSVEKLRGSDFLTGQHAFDITTAGLKVYPRLLSPSHPPAYEDKIERVNTGIPGLDEMIEQGFWRGSTTLIAGPTGSGKTAIGLNFICEGVKLGEAGLYLGFQENPVQLARTLRNYGWDPPALFNEGGFTHLYWSPVELQLDRVVLELFRHIQAGKVKRIVIDALGDLMRSSHDHDRFVEYIYALSQWFAVAGVTCLMMLELPNLFEIQRLSEGDVSNASDNVVLLRFSGEQEMMRTIRIIKTRNSNHDHFERTLRITSQGVRVEPKSGQ
jgi:circadian clock protein KaiC